MLQDECQIDSDALKRVIPFNPKLDHVKKFKKVCELKEDDDSLPILYPAVVVLYPSVCLMAAPEYPFPAIGSVHVYNTTKLNRKISMKESLAFVLKPDKMIRHAKKGSEVEFISTLTDSANKTVWTNSSKFLIMHNQRKDKQEEVSSKANAAVTWVEPLESDLVLVSEEIWPLGPNASIQYASVSSDYNPIHVSSLAAKLTGFPGIIMHGMYLIARAASECQRVMGEEGKPPVEISTKFQRPCVLPQKVTFRVFNMKSSRKQLYFTVKGKNDKILLDGYLKLN